MEYLFDMETLPDSFTIERVNYVGYSLIFNGPDGPRRSSYLISIDAEDFVSMRQELLTPPQ